ncbi:aminotransferase class I/II-fold pyridoxal phosphate-dependent enzyme [Candidatus Saccharibacteria bacterium]|nr:aminotransferase class I/II-fold pyridoxal phosphate-dependent enzyme [Candidatus Saccharibacteria bacterium]
MHIASQIAKLGIETSFEVAAAASDWSHKGHKVYPFHIGDINLHTPYNIVEAVTKAIRDGYTGYCPGAGIIQLRMAMAEEIGRKWGAPYEPENVSIQPGGKPVVGKFLEAVMEPGDEVLYPNPGYPIYESQIEFQGGIAVPYGYIETEKGFALDLESMRRAITPRTKILVCNNYHNPTAARSSRAEMEAVAELAIRHNLMVLSDDAYYEIQYDEPADSIVTLPGMQERTVILYTFSKRYAMTGWRIGAAIGPRKIIDIINKLNSNAESCTSHFIQWAAIEALTGSETGPNDILAELKRRRDAAVAGLNAIDGISVAAPSSSFFLFPNVTKIMERKGITDVNLLMDLALKQAGVSFCTHKHFGRPRPEDTQSYIRIAYSGIDVEDIHFGMERLKEYFES